MKKLLCLGLFVLFAANMAFSEDGGEIKSRGDYLTVKVAVIGPGDELYFWWGHLGLIIEDAITGRAHFIDYGVFSFRQTDFFSNFALGRLWYTTAESPAEAVIQRYIEDNRDITVYTLNLSAAQKEEMLAITMHNLLPENSDYLYNHFSDNCVTRITNTLDAVLGGQFYAQAANTPGRWTLRQEIRRFMARHPVWDLLLNFWMGQVIDKQISVKEEMFLPEETGVFIENFTYIDADGNEQKLCGSIEKIWTAKNRPLFLDAPRSIFWTSLIVGIFLAALLYLVSPPYKRGKKTKKYAVLQKRLFGMGNTLLGLIGGIAGSLLFFMEFFSDHDYTYQNSNILFANPLLLVAIPFGILFAFSRNEGKVRLATQVLRILWTYVLLTALLAVIIKILPAYYQDNWAPLAIVIPISLVLSKVPLGKGKGKRDDA
ncbi:MAG: DUF4105 domain-containing protein [Spirochaetaceae bacterium]|jgi:hypothetical protein|nr:DUF4105 domain-containing protein [Spirochaetaceae bacterium]